MVPQELKFYILHDLCVVSMVSVFPGSKTAYFIISKNRSISRLKKKSYKKEVKNIYSTETELFCNLRAEKNILKSLCINEYDFFM